MSLILTTVALDAVLNAQNASRAPVFSIAFLISMLKPQVEITKKLLAKFNTDSVPSAK
jgi:hypothetical protein